MNTNVDQFQLFTSIRYDLQLGRSTANHDSDPQLNNSADNLYMLPYHRDRMLQAAEHFDWNNTKPFLLDFGRFALSVTDKVTAKLGENANQEPITSNGKGPLRVKIVVHEDGRVDVETGLTPPVALDALFPHSLDLPQHRKESKPLKVSPLTGGGLTLGSHDFIPTSQDGAPPWPIYVDTQRTVPSAFTKYKTSERSMYNSARSRADITDLGVEKEVLLVSNTGEIMEGSMTTPYFRRQERWVTPPLASGGQMGTTRRWALEKDLCVEGVVRVEELEDGEDIWLLARLTSLLLFISLGTSLKFDIQAHPGHESASKERCIRNFVAKDQLVVVTATVSGSRGDGMVLNMHIKDAVGNDFHKPRDVAGENRYAFTSHSDSAFDVCFENVLDNHAQTHTPIRHVELDIDIGADAKDWSAIQAGEKLKPVETELRRIEELVEEIVSEMDYLKGRETKLRDTNESTNERVKWFAYGTMGMLVGLGAWQVVYLRAYFRSKHLI
ncbi:MAG: vesicle coat component [Bathelium mastoideum]|nr:MAG: vesicle coat component [Bathelium mastoideum]KAI9694799.1 MAG: vesicle coat component [Bathelium mastoideum]